MLKKLLLLAIIFLPIVSSCQKKKGVLMPKKIELPANGQKIVEANNTFGIEVFDKINSFSSNKNLIFSPLSLHIAMTMAFNGACHKTALEIQNALKLNNIALEDVNNCYKTLLKELAEVDPKVTFAIANSFWFNNNFFVLDGYKSTLKNYFNAQVRNLNFTNVSAINTINKWCSDNTKGKIDKIIESLSADEVAILLNALYFNGKWYQKFEKSNTQDRDFYLADNTTIQVATMQQQNDFLAQVYETFTVVELPYGQGNFAIDLFLPAKNKTIVDLIDSLKNFDRIIKELMKYNVNIFLPKFEYKSDFELVEILKIMGINEAFIDRADFCNISNSQQINISKVKQKTYIKLDEEGTEAAAVTQVSFKLTAAVANNYLEVHFDRPFLYVIRETTTNTIIFIGTVANPN